MLKIAGRPNAVLDKGQTPGVTYGVEWVTIDDPDPTFAPGTTNNQAIQAVGAQGRAKGAATFSRLEGIFYDSGKVYLVSTQGGDTPAGEPPPAGYGDGFGQLWVYDTRQGRRSRCCSSRRAATCSSCPTTSASARASARCCARTGRSENYLRGVTPDGEIFDFARNAIAGRQQEEFAGSTFTPDGKVLFVNIQASQRPDVRDLGPVEARGAVALPP